MWACFIVTYMSLGRLLPRPISWLGSKLGEISYSVYLIHFAVIAGIIRHGLYIRPTGNGYYDALVTTLLVALPITLGWILLLDPSYGLVNQAWRALPFTGQPLLPYFFESYSNLGDAYRRLDRKDDAVAAYQKAIDLMRPRLAVNEADPDLLVQLALMLAGAGRCAEADGAADRAAAAPAESSTAHYYAAVAYAICKNRDKAVAEARLAIEGGAVADVKTNPDLAEIRTDPAIEPLLAEAQPADPAGGVR